MKDPFGDFARYYCELNKAPLPGKLYSTPRLRRYLELVQQDKLTSQLDPTIEAINKRNLANYEPWAMKEWLNEWRASSNGSD